MKTRLIALLLGLTAFLFAPACQTLTDSGEPERLTVQYLTLKYIDGDRDRALRVVDRVDEISAVVENENLLIAELRSRVDEIIPWSDLGVEEMFLIQELMDIIQAELDANIQTGVIPEDQRVYLQTYLGWIRQIADRAVRWG